MFDLQSFCRARGIPLIESGHHHTHHGWMQMHCPFCTDGRHGWHLGYSIERGNLNCWRCGSHRIWDLLVKVLKDDQEVRKAFATYQTTSRPMVPAERVRRKTLWTPPGLGDLHKAHRRYLLWRGFDPGDLIAEWDLQATKYLSGEWSWRVVFPICDREGDVQAYCGRAISENARPKYKMPMHADIPVDPQQLLYGVHRVPGDAVVIVEGPTDVWRLGPGAVATLGIDWKQEQPAILREYRRRFVMYDPGREAQARANQLAEWLGMFDGETEVVSGLPCDPGDLPQKEADAIMKELLG